MRRRAQNSTSQPIMFFMADSTDHISGLTGLTPTVTLSKNGGSFAAADGAVSEVGNGWYALAGDADDRDTEGTLIIHAEATGADPFDMDYEIGAGELSTEPSGSETYTDWLRNTTTLDPVAGAYVEAYSDSDRTTLVGRKTTDVNGYFTFYLDPGTYYMRARKPGIEFDEWEKVITST